MSLDSIVNIISKGPKVMIVFGSIATSYLIFTECFGVEWRWAMGITCFVGAFVWLAYDEFGPKIKDRFFTSKTEKAINYILRDIDAEMELVLFQAKNQVRTNAPNQVKLTTEFHEYITAKEKEINKLEVEATKKKEILALVGKKMQQFSGNMSGIYSKNPWMGI